MNLEEQIKQRLPDLMAGLSACWDCPLGANTDRGLNLAGQLAVQQVLKDIVSVLFPGCHGHEPVPDRDMAAFLSRKLSSTLLSLKQQVKRAFEYDCRIRECDDCDKCEEKADEAVLFLLESVPHIQGILQKDIAEYTSASSAVK